MSIEPGKASPEGGKKPEDRAETGGDLGRRAEGLDKELSSFDKEAAEADRMLERIKDPAKREEFKSALSSLRGRAGGVGNALRGAVAGLALFAGGVGMGKGMNDERHEAAMVEMAKKSGEADAENRMLKAELAKRDAERADRASQTAAKEARGEKAADRAMDAMAGENAALRRQLEDMSSELGKLRQGLDEANARVIAEKEKGIVTQDALFKQQAVSGNLQQLYQKMKDLIDASGDPKLKEDADRFLAAYE